MRDVSGKQTTLRRARARAVLKASKEAVDLLRANKLAKADPLPVAKVAAVQAAKQTSLLIPYCHPLPIDFVDCRFEVGLTSVTVETEVKAIARTGVEMEALAAVSAAVLTLYDMMKAVDETMEITEIRLLEKAGGKSDFRRFPIRGAPSGSNS
ncbi:MAG: cyclic pyranopterin monophosphate synthase MoaC [Ignavibacteriales bacterium]|nr:cyclic pyranopterin monophosphate synthase MoaC [Ignavibacteriales bacterium]